MYSILIFILFILWILYSFVGSDLLFGDYTVDYLGYAVISMNLLIGLSFVISHNWRLFGIITFHRKSINPSIAVGNDMTSNEESYEVELNPRQHKLLEASIKASLLNTITVVSLESFVIIWVLYHLEVMDRYNLITLILRSLSVIVELYCVYLTFPFNSGLYAQLCGCSHNVCKRVCAKVTKAGEIRKYEPKQSDAN